MVLLKSMLLTWLAYASFYVMRKAASVGKIGLERKLGYTVAELGIVDSSYLLAYACGQFIFGTLADRHNPCGVIAFGLLSSVCICFVAPWAAKFSALLLGVAWVVHGLAQATGHPAIMRHLAPLLQNHPRKGALLRVWSTSQAAGGMFGNIVCAMAYQRYGLVCAFTLPVLPALVMAVAFGKESFAENQRTMISTAGRCSKTSASGVTSVQISLWKIPGMVPTAVTFFIVKSLRYAMLLWLPYFNFKVLGYSEFDAACFATMFEFGGLVGGVLLGHLIDTLFVDPAIVTALAMVAGSASIAMYNILGARGSDWRLLCLAMLMVGITVDGVEETLGTYMVGHLAERTSSGAAIVGRITGTVNGVGTLGACLVGPLLGALDRFSTTGWQRAFDMFPVLCGLGALTILPLASNADNETSWAKRRHHLAMLSISGLALFSMCTNAALDVGDMGMAQSGPMDPADMVDDVTFPNHVERSDYSYNSYYHLYYLYSYDYHYREHDQEYTDMMQSGNAGPIVLADTVNGVELPKQVRRDEIKNTLPEQPACTSSNHENSMWQAVQNKTCTEKLRFKMMYDRRPMLVDAADKFAIKRYADISGVHRAKVLFACGALGCVGEAKKAWRKRDRVPTLLSFLLWTNQSSVVLKANSGYGKGHSVKVLRHLDRWRWDKKKALQELEEIRDWILEQLDRLANRIVGHVDLRKAIKSNKALATYGYGYKELPKEWAYTQIFERYVFVEEFIPYENEYKIIVMSGEPRFISIKDPKDTKRRAIYELPWRGLKHCWYSETKEFLDIDPPPILKELVDTARILGTPFDFVRVDLFLSASTPQHVYVNEITNYHNAGKMCFFPTECDQLAGNKWTLPPMMALKCGTRRLIAQSYRVLPVIRGIGCVCPPARAPEPAPERRFVSLPKYAAVMFDFDRCLASMDVHGWLMETPSRLTKAKREQIVDRLGGSKRIASVAALLSKLRNANIQRSIISYGLKENIIEVLRRVGLFEFFDDTKVYGRAELGLKRDEDVASPWFKVDQVANMRMNGLQGPVLFVDDRLDFVQAIATAQVADSVHVNRDSGLDPSQIEKIALGGARFEQQALEYRPHGENLTTSDLYMCYLAQGCRLQDAASTDPFPYHVY